MGWVLMGRGWRHWCGSRGRSGGRSNSASAGDEATTALAQAGSSQMGPGKRRSRGMQEPGSAGPATQTGASKTRPRAAAARQPVRTSGGGTGRAATLLDARRPGPRQDLFACRHCKAVVFLGERKACFCRLRLSRNEKVSSETGASERAAQSGERPLERKPCARLGGRRPEGTEARRRSENSQLRSKGTSGEGWGRAEQSLRWGWQSEALGEAVQRGSAATHRARPPRPAAAGSPPRRRRAARPRPGGWRPWRSPRRQTRAASWTR